jgi:hypothetical protein
MGKTKLIVTSIVFVAFVAVAVIPFFKFDILILPLEERLFAASQMGTESLHEHQGIHVNSLIETRIENEVTEGTPSIYLSGEDRGNTNGNIVSGSGLVAQKDGWIYYAESYLHGRRNSQQTGYRLVRINDESGEREVLLTTESPIAEINVMEDIIVFTLSGKLHRINRDGSNLVRFFEEGPNVQNVHVVGDWIVFVYPTPRRGTSMYRMHIDGSNLEIIAETETNEGVIRSVNIYEDWIFYYVQVSTTIPKRIYRIRIDGTEQTLLAELRTFPNIIVDGGWIYFIPLLEEELRPPHIPLHRMRTDGSELQRIINENVYRFSVSNGWIYYTTSPETVDNLFRIRVDGTGREMIVEGTENNFIFGLNIVDDWVYFNDIKPLGRNTSQANLFRTHKDGAHWEVVFRTFTR